ncbi:Lipase_3 domain-containing protein [Cephalotus follicularis]|uniref:Lipase_3 domain-containing protein n=1 Tax=Cephalotus follicularis TaxID=3775 RepID=A0A1Q3BB71_CEPFO|nr:Lipase_3 domain-containing protein [Cephalotus follicularis]
MDTEASPFEASEMLAEFLASTPLLKESWRLCSLANTRAPQSFVIEQIGSIGYVAFSAIQMGQGSEPSCRNLVPLDSASDGIFFSLHRYNEGEESVMVHAGFLQLFSTMYNRPDFQTQMLALMEDCKSIVITGHSLGGTTASLAALWLLSYVQSTSSPLSVLCITFGSPLLGNESLSRVILRERWGGNFCHVVSKHDIMPRLLFAPLAPLAQQLHILVQFWHLSMTSSHSGQLLVQLHDEQKAEIFRFVLTYLEVLEQSREGLATNMFWPFGSYFFCSGEGAICMDNAASIVKMMHLMLETSNPTCSIEDHLKYGDYVEKVSLQFLKNTSFIQGDLPESSYEAGVALAVQSSGIASQEPVAILAKDCLKTARRMGRRPNLNMANLAIKLSQVNPYRAEIEWYKAICDESDDQMGYYDSFKRRNATKREFKVNMNRHKLASFWNYVIFMLENNHLPHDFNRRAKWVNASQFYKLLVEPLDIAEYYRSGMHRVNGHYIRHGRERRYEIFDRWWKDRHCSEEETRRSKFASLTQDSCFWAKVEEAREWLDNVRSESDIRKRALLWENIYNFERYARMLVENKEVSIDVLAKNSSYALWVEDWRVLKSQVQQFPHQLPGFLNEVVP